MNSKKEERDFSLRHQLMQILAVSIELNELNSTGYSNVLTLFKAKSNQLFFSPKGLFWILTTYLAWCNENNQVLVQNIF